MSISTDDLGRITQQTAVMSADGDKLGTINQIYTSDTTGEPAWVTLKTGLFGTQESFVPLADAAFEGDDIRVPVTKQQVHDAPRVDADGHLSVEEEDDLYRYYGVHNPGHPGGESNSVAERDGLDRRDTTDGQSTTDGRSTTDGQDTRDGQDTGDSHGGHAAEVGSAVAAGAAGAAGTAALTDRDRDAELAQRDVEGRDQVADRPDVEPQRAQQVDPDGSDRPDDDVKPGERTTQLRRYVVTERVVRTVEELPEDEPRG